jgi:hypothetical protein
LELAAVFVADRKPVEQILDGEEADPFEVGGSTWTDALEKLQRRREQIRGHMTLQSAFCNY